LNYPYGGSYLYGVSSARRQLGVPYANFYDGNYYGPFYANLYDPVPFNYMIRFSTALASAAAWATAGRVQGSI
jgi:hypothetical protein